MAKTTCPTDLASAVKALLASRPESAVSAQLGLARATIARLAAGMSVHEGTIAQARARMSEPADPRQMSLPGT